MGAIWHMFERAQGEAPLQASGALIVNSTVGAAANWRVERR